MRNTTTNVSGARCVIAVLEGSQSGQGWQLRGCSNKGEEGDVTATCSAECSAFSAKTCDNISIASMIAKRVAISKSSKFFLALATATGCTSPATLSTVTDGGFLFQEKPDGHPTDVFYA